MQGSGLKKTQGQEMRFVKLGTYFNLRVLLEHWNMHQMMQKTDNSYATVKHVNECERPPNSIVLL